MTSGSPHRESSSKRQSKRQQVTTTHDSIFDAFFTSKKRPLTPPPPPPLPPPNRRQIFWWPLTTLHKGGTGGKVGGASWPELSCLHPGPMIFPDLAWSWWPWCSWLSWWSRWSCLISDVFYSTNSQCNHLFSPRFPFNCFQGHTVGAPVILAVAAVCVGNTIVLFPGSSTHSPLFFSKSRFVHKSPWGSLHLILIKKRTSIISCATKINEKKFLPKNE